ASKSTGPGAGAGAAEAWVARPRASAQVRGERRSRLRREEVGMMSSFKVAWSDLVGGAGAGWRPAGREWMARAVRRPGARSQVVGRRQTSQRGRSGTGAWTR